MSFYHLLFLRIAIHFSNGIVILQTKRCLNVLLFFSTYQQNPPFKSNATAPLLINRSGERCCCFQWRSGGCSVDFLERGRGSICPWLHIRVSLKRIEEIIQCFCPNEFLVLQADLACCYILEAQNTWLMPGFL
jgi:hypothetical protein